MTASERIIEARVYSATCTMCDRPNCTVRESFAQSCDRFGATAGPQSLGFQGFCPDCQCCFMVAEPQEVLGV
jgi:hypothetical protein